MDIPILVDKPLGATPLQALTLLRSIQPSLREARLSYAGRLDPMATGLLTVLSGSQLQRQEEYWVLPKVYEAAILLGWTTDSYDLLGVPHRDAGAQVPLSTIHTAIAGIVGRQLFALPAFSSYRVAGESLFVHARRGSLGVLPQREMMVHQADVLGNDLLDTDTLRALVHDGVSRVHGDFRQSEIIARWDEALSAGEQWPLVRVRIACAGGTYIRALANELGVRLGVGACVAALRRIAVGEWRVTDPAVVRLSWPQ